MSGSNNFQAVDQEIMHYGVIDGIHYGRQVRVLARDGRSVLIYVPGQSYYSDRITGCLYSPAHMIVHYIGGRGWHRFTSRGRIKDQLAENAEVIDRMFGDGFSKLLDPKKTIIVGSEQ